MASLLMPNCWEFEAMFSNNYDFDGAAEELEGEIQEEDGEEEEEEDEEDEDDQEEE